MAFATYANKENVNLDQFSRIERGHWTYWSVFNARLYHLRIVRKNGKFYWTCNCPDARYISHPHGDQCKHEIALARMLKSQYERKCMAEIQAEQIAEEAQEKAEQREEIEDLRAEVAQLRAAMPDFIDIALQKQVVEELRAELAEARAEIQQPDLTEIMVELAELRAENEQIKKALACKATARKKHQSEQETADIKHDMNLLANDVVSAANSAIQTVSMWKKRLADLEAIPHELKKELDAWTEAGREELQPDYQPEEHNAPEIKAQIREAQEISRQRREATEEERRKIAPLNGNSGFSFLK